MNTLEKNVDEILGRYEASSLKELESKGLLKRYDTKFIISTEFIPELLDYLKIYYNVLDISGIREFTYHNQYLDTKDYCFFNQHHNGKLNRTKLRFRKYLESGISMFEIKQRTNNRRTVKERIGIDFDTFELNSDAEQLIKNKLNGACSDFLPKLKVNYKRITLLQKESAEKITIDRDIYFKNSVNDLSLKNLALIEVKQLQLSYLTPVMIFLREKKHLPIINFSKYCIGLVLTDPNVKYNRFKKRILFINKHFGTRYGTKHS